MVCGVEAWDVGGEEGNRGGGVREIEGVGGGGEGFLEGFPERRGFGGEERAGLGIAVEEEDAEGNRGGSGWGGGHFLG